MDPVFRKKAKDILSIFIKSGLTNKRIVVFASNTQCRFHSIGKKKKKERTDLFDYERILEQEFFMCEEYYKGNTLYGIADSIRKYSGYSHKICACIEHGVYFGKSQIEIETSKSGLPAVINFSPARTPYIRELTDKPIISIGPYILYANNYYSKSEIIACKEKMGSILLVFPSHSGEGIVSEFDSQVFISEVKKFKETHNFDTVIICLYYNDILLGRDEPYKKEGFLISTGGRREDKAFLGRLRSLIEISDYTASNAVGTHVGYCVALGKPHIILTNTTIEYSGKLKSQSGNDEVSLKNKQEVLARFIDYSSEITDEQMQIVEKYWGLSKHKTPNEMYTLLTKCEVIFNETKHKEADFVEKAKDVFGDSEVMG